MARSLGFNHVQGTQDGTRSSFGDLPTFIGRPREQQSTSVAAIALEFTILTCARTGETLGARWLEFDLDAKIWRVPAARMKGRREHRVPLAARALEIIEDLSKVRVGDFVFPGRRLSETLSDNSMLTVLRKMKIAAVTVHGFRSSFSDWASEKTSFPYEVIEAWLAHVVGNSVARASARGHSGKTPNLPGGMGIVLRRETPRGCHSNRA